MNSALDRWGASPSPLHENDKENLRKASRGNDSKKKKKEKKARQPMQPQQQAQGTQNLKPLRANAPAGIGKKTSGSTSSGASHDGSSSMGSRRQSGPAARALGGAGPSSETEAPPPVDSVFRDPAAELEMNEVSTMAGDTYAGVEMDARVAEAVPPFGVSGAAASGPPEMFVTPTNRDDTDEYGYEDLYGYSEDRGKKPEHFLFDERIETISPVSTQPETPEKDGDIEGGNEECVPPLCEDKEFSPKKQRRWRCIICAGCWLAFFLVVGISMLGYTLYAVRNEDKGALSLFSKEFWVRAGDEIQDALFFWQDDEDENEKTMAPTQDFWFDATETSTSFPGTEWPTMPPSTVRDAIEAVVLSAAVDRGIASIVGAAMSDPYSVHYSVVDWLANDPNLESYPDEKIVQRYALACFYERLVGDNGNDAESPVAPAVRDTWGTYGDECTTWASTERANSNNNSSNNNNNSGSTKQTCDSDGLVRSIHLERVGLDGTLSPELALLSESLESIYLTKNSIHGTIPSAWGKLTNLKRLQLSKNNIEGSLNGPELIGNLDRLEIIGLGNNRLTGTLPEELGSLPSLFYLNLPSNGFTGSIPSFANASGVLGHVSFRSNALTGSLPEELALLESLDALFLEDNDLEGLVPESVCAGDATHNGMNMVVDCGSVGCSCCKGCAVFYANNNVSMDSFREAERPSAPASNATTVREDPIDLALNSTAAPVDAATVADGATAEEASDAASNATVDAMVDATVDATSDAAADDTVDVTVDVTSEAAADEASDATADATANPVSDVTVDETSEVTTDAAADATAEESMVAEVPTDEADKATNSSAPETGNCESIEVGFPCYNPGWSIDFELSHGGCGILPTEEYDFVAVYLSGREDTAIGTKSDLGDALFWASSCGLPACDGVIANGQMYYRNTYPSTTAPLDGNPWWPISAGSMMRLRWLRSDETATGGNTTGIVVAESLPFVVADGCQ